jgi:hypothetical protein
LCLKNNEAPQNHGDSRKVKMGASIAQMVSLPLFLGHPADLPATGPKPAQKTISFHI